MHERAHRVALPLIPSLILVALVAACAVPSTSPPVTTGTPSLDGVGPVVPTVCYGLQADECQRVAQVAVSSLGNAAPVRYIQVGPFGCPVEGCPKTLAARPEGDVTVDLADGTQSAVHITAGPGGAIDSNPSEAFGIAVEPASGPLGPGPVPFSLGHCGLFSSIDLDGSLWDPVGVVDSDHFDAINSAQGTVTFNDPNRATFVSKGGLTVQLVRHPGAKLLPGCM